MTNGITDRMKDIEKVLAQLEDLSRKWKTEGREGAQAPVPGHGPESSYEVESSSEIASET